MALIALRDRVYCVRDVVLLDRGDDDVRGMLMSEERRTDVYGALPLAGALPRRAAGRTRFRGQHGASTGSRFRQLPTQAAPHDHAKPA